ncbi:MAG: amino acid deaminase/aldolase, partial [Bdellovibrionia bacterium]
VYPEGVELTATEGCGEVQTPLKFPSGVKINLGDPVLFRHAKAGELAERFNEYLLVSNGKLINRAKTYRGFGQCFF